MKIKISNFKLCFGTFFLTVLLVLGISFYNAYKEHEKRLILVSEKRIIEACQTCFLEDKCEGKIVTLKELIQLNYLKEEVNPITKMYYSQDSYVAKENNTYVFHGVD